MNKNRLYNIKSVTVLFAFTNCLLGCSLGFYYGVCSLRSVSVALCILICGCAIQSLCNFSIDYSRAYKKHKADKLNGISSPIMIGEFSLTQKRKSMALVTLSAAVSGTFGIYVAVGSNIQILSWFVFLCALMILLTLFFTSTTVYRYKGIGAIAIYVVFACVSIMGAQFMIVASSHSTIDVYPDAYLLAASAVANSLIILYSRSLRPDNVEKKVKTISQFIGYELSSIYLVLLVAGSAFFSILACITSHTVEGSFFIMLSYTPMGYYAYKILKHNKSFDENNRQFNKIILSCSMCNLVWVGVLIADYWIYS